jgi:predicted N-acetyltransferase YhbS
MITIRTEHPEDIPLVRIINEQAFGQPAEANIVDRLRQTCPECLSLVADKVKALKNRSSGLCVKPNTVQVRGG